MCQMAEAQTADYFCGNISVMTSPFELLGGTIPKNAAIVGTISVALVCRNVVPFLMPAPNQTSGTWSQSV